MKTNHFLKAAILGSVIALSTMSLDAMAYWHTQYHTHTCRNGYCQTHTRVRTCAGRVCHYHYSNHYYYR